MVEWHHRLDGREFEQAPGESEGQGGLACCRPRGRGRGVRHRRPWPQAQMRVPFPACTCLCRSQYVQNMTFWYIFPFYRMELFLLPKFPWV